MGGGLRGGGVDELNWSWLCFEMRVCVEMDMTGGGGFGTWSRSRRRARRVLMMEEQSVLMA